MTLLVLCILLDHDAKGTRVSLCCLLLYVFPCGTSIVVLRFDHIYFVGQMFCFIGGVCLYCVCVSSKRLSNVVRV